MDSATIEELDALDSCGSCGAHVGPSTSFPWHYGYEDCRTLRGPEPTFERRQRAVSSTLLAFGSYAGRDDGGESEEALLSLMVGLLHEADWQAEEMWREARDRYYIERAEEVGWDA